MSDSDDEPITLSSHALAALAEFEAEKDASQQKFEKLRTGITTGGPTAPVISGDEPLSISAFAEDWNESQFWVRKTCICQAQPVPNLVF